MLGSTVNKQLQYQFDLEVERVTMKMSLQCYGGVSWKRNKKFITTKNYIHLQPFQKCFDFNEKLSIMGNCKLVNGKFDLKETQIDILIRDTFLPNPNEKDKYLGRCKLEITQIIDPNHFQAFFSKKFEMKLDSLIENARIIFTLTAIFKKECSNGSLTDISFQASSNTNMFSRTTNDMTFRPPSIESRREEHKNSRPPREPKQHERGRVSSSQQQQQNYFREHRENEQKPYEQKKGRVEQPLGFSFGPQCVNPNEMERQRERRQMVDQITELNRELDAKKMQIERMKNNIRGQNQQNKNSVTEKTLALMNDLNSNQIMIEQLKREKQEMNHQFARLQQQNQQILANYKKIKEEMTFEKNQMSYRYEQKKRATDEMTLEFNQMAMELNQMKKLHEDQKNQLFKKQSLIIEFENRTEQMEGKINSNSKQLPLMEQIKKSNEELMRQRAEIEKLLNDKHLKLTKEQQIRNILDKRCKALEEELSREKENMQNLKSLMDGKEAERISLLNEIEQEMNFMRNQKLKLTEEKQAETLSLHEKLSSLQRNLEECQIKQESNFIQISEFKVKIKNLEEACQHLEKQVNDKEEMIEQAKKYVKQKQTEVENRDEFIERAKQYITNKQAEFESERKRLISEFQQTKSNSEQSNKLLEELHGLKKDNSEKEKYLMDYMDELESRNQRIDDLQSYIQTLQEKLSISQDQFEEIVRKTRSQQETLEDLIKKNLDLEIQLNVKKFELQAVLNRKS